MSYTVPGDLKVEILVPNAKAGNWEIRDFVVDQEGATIHNMSETISGTRRFIAPGSYKALYFSGERDDFEGDEYPVMTNTPSEILDLFPFVKDAYGNVLVFGLGLGVAIQLLLKNSLVSSITVVEKDESVISLSGDHYKNLSDKIKIIQADAYEFSDDSNKYHFLWVDIWNYIRSENYSEMMFFRDKWESKVNFMGCWAEERCQELYFEDLQA